MWATSATARLFAQLLSHLNQCKRKSWRVSKRKLALRPVNSIPRTAQRTLLASKDTMERSARNRWILICSLYLLSCVVVDFVPSFGPPHFRYTGSDPSVHVWNLGWPLPYMIYDPRSGLHVDPFGVVVIGLQVLVVVVVGLVMLRKRPTAILVIAQLFLLWLFWEKANRIYWLIRLWPTRYGAEPSDGLVFCDICDFAWSYWFLVVPAGFGLIVACGLVHRHLMRTHRRVSARILAYATICALAIGWSLLLALESTFRDQLQSL